MPCGTWPETLPTNREMALSSIDKPRKLLAITLLALFGGELGSWIVTARVRPVGAGGAVRELAWATDVQTGPGELSPLLLDVVFGVGQRRPVRTTDVTEVAPAATLTVDVDVDDALVVLLVRVVTLTLRASAIPMPLSSTSSAAAIATRSAKTKVKVARMTSWAVLGVKLVLKEPGSARLNVLDAKGPSRDTARHPHPKVGPTF